jgi:ubiquinone/menaquinone biosynthesis C-methylase UbiE
LQGAPNIEHRHGRPQGTKLVNFNVESRESFACDGTGRLLDLGCGTGQLTLPLAEHVAETVGMDRESEMLTEASRQAQADHITNVTWVQGNSADLPGHRQHR